jgi:hypothetical protein
MFLLEAAGWWVVLSCVLGPCATWLFFYGERRGRELAHANRKRTRYRPALQLSHRRLPQLVHVRVR